MEYMDSQISETERLNLKKMISECETIDNTDHIRKVKHSIPMATEIQLLEKLKMQHINLRATDPVKFSEICESRCSFLYNNYTDIFHKLVKDEINLEIMQQFLQVLHRIEEGQINQQEGSVIVGKLLKELYLDSAIRRGENLDKENPPPLKIDGKKISWNEFRNSRL